MIIEINDNERLRILEALGTRRDYLGNLALRKKGVKYNAQELKNKKMYLEQANECAKLYTFFQTAK